jgi:TRAP transporter 4TM/12TM fusion protein
MSHTTTSTPDIKGPPQGGPATTKGISAFGKVSGALCVGIALYHVAVSVQLFANMGFFLESQVQAAISLACAVVAVFLLPSGKARAHRKIPLWVIDVVLVAAALFGLSVVMFDYDQILTYSMYGSLDRWGVLLALCVVLPLLEALRRKTGMVLPLIILALVGVVVFQQYMPGLLYGRGYSIDRLLYSSYIGGNGIFGLPLHVAAEIILVFIVFGALISISGAGAWFLDLALIMTGRQTGGPAKAAVVASALFGSVSGSPSANAASTGVLTIPLMMRAGYTPAFAGAVEAVASTSGQILPPVMGAIAFVMAEWTGNTYATIVKVAAIPAILYILILFCSVHFQAKRQGIAKIDVSGLPPLWQAFRRGWYYLLPLGVLCWGLFWAHLPAQMAASLSFPVIIAVSFLNQDRNYWLTPRRIAEGLIDSVHNWKGIAIITAAVGIMVGAMDLSGVGLKISDFIISLSGGNLIVTLLLIGVAALVLGMGLDAIPAYVTLATLLAPALIKMGVPVLGAHFFVVYWGLASFFTPPLCIAVFVTTSISGGNIWATGWEAVRLGLGAFLVPFAFVLEPALLLQGDIGTIILATTTALVGAVLLSAALRGYLIAPLGVLGRLTLGAAAVLFIAPGVMLPLVGAGTAGLILLVQKFLPELRLINEPPSLSLSQ